MRSPGKLCVKNVEAASCRRGGQGGAQAQAEAGGQAEKCEEEKLLGVVVVVVDGCEWGRRTRRKTSEKDEIVCKF